MAKIKKKLNKRNRIQRPRKKIKNNNKDRRNRMIKKKNSNCFKNKAKFLIQKLKKQPTFPNVSLSPSRFHLV